jgi:hypothetical protein
MTTIIGRAEEMRKVWEKYLAWLRNGDYQRATSFRSWMPLRVAIKSFEINRKPFFPGDIGNRYLGASPTSCSTATARKRPRRAARPSDDPPLAARRGKRSPGVRERRTVLLVSRAVANAVGASG